MSGDNEVKQAATAVGSNRVQAAIKFGTRILAFSLLVPGLLMGYVGCSKTVGAMGTWVGGESATGVVTSIRQTRGSPAPVQSPSGEYSSITFTTAEGKVITFEHPVGSTTAPYAQGERVKVVYDADEPEEAVVPGGLTWLVLGWGLLAVAGVILVLTAAALLLIGALPWRRQRTRTEVDTA